MKKRSIRPSFERLEDRTTPTVTATAASGLLSVSGAATRVGDTIKIRLVVPTLPVASVASVLPVKNIQVYDGAALVGSFAASSISVKLTSANDFFDLDLNGTTLPGSVNIALGDGNNTAVVHSGVIVGALNVTSGVGVDKLDFLGVTVGTAALNQNAYVNLGSGDGDHFYVGYDSRFNGFLFTDSANYSTIDAGVKISGSLVYSADYGTGILDVGAAVAGDVTFYSPGNTVSASVIVRSTASIGGNIAINGGAANDNIDLDFTGTTFAHNVSVNLGGGDNKLVVHSGIVQGAVTVVGGGGSDYVYLQALTVGLDVNVNLAGGYDQLYVGIQSHFLGNLFAQDVNAVTLDYYNTVDKSVRVGGDVTKTTADIRGAVGLDVLFSGNTYNTQGDFYRIASTGCVGRDVLVQGTAGPDTLIIEGAAAAGQPSAKIGRNLSATMNAGDDVVTVGAGTVIGGAAFFLMGDGKDSLAFGGRVGNGSGMTLYVDAGAGDDYVDVQSSSYIQGETKILLGDGNDTMKTPDNRNYMYVFFVDGGAGIDCLFAHNNTGVTYAGFEKFP